MKLTIRQLNVTGILALISLALLVAISYELLMGNVFDHARGFLAPRFWVHETLALTLVFISLVILTGNLLKAWLYSLLLLCLFLMINNEKVMVFETIFMPADFIYMTEAILAWDALKSYWLPLTAVTTLLVVWIYFCAKISVLSVSNKHRWVLLAMCCVLLVTVRVFDDELKKKLRSYQFKETDSHMIRHAMKNGFLSVFVLNVLLPEKAIEPPGYSASTMNALIEKYTSGHSKSTTGNKPDVIIFFIEAFTDPLQSGLKTTQDPIPHFRHLSTMHASGHTLAPVIGGRSANSEFELLSGMSMRFLNRFSIPYIDHLNRPIDGLPQMFRRLGYQTHAIHVASLAFFNYLTAYPNLGFEFISTIRNHPDSQLDVARRFPDEDSLVNRIIATTEQHNGPHFIFAFPNSTHGFWDYPQYLESDLDVIDPNFGHARDAVKTYINALQKADLAIHKLITHYAQVDRETIVLILGDHYPNIIPYLSNNLKHQKNLNGPLQVPDDLNDLDFYKYMRTHHPEVFHVALHKVPYVMWTNFSNDAEQLDVSMNLLHQRILQAVPAQRSPFQQLNHQLFNQMPEFSIVVNHAGLFQMNVPDQLRELVDDFQLFQYDMLHGDNHYAEWLANSSWQEPAR